MTPRKYNRALSSNIASYHLTSCCFGLWYKVEQVRVRDDGSFEGFEVLSRHLTRGSADKAWMNLQAKLVALNKPEKRGWL